MNPKGAHPGISVGAFVCAAVLLFFCGRPARAAETVAAGDYAAVDAIFSKYCLDCHASQDPEAKLVLESFDTLMKGSENGPVVAPGRGDDSLLLRMVEGKVEKDGKQIIMPPGKKRKKLEPPEIAVIKAWIDGGARGPAIAAAVIRELDVPKIVPKGQPRNPINVLIRVPGGDLAAVGRYGEVELRSAATAALVRTLGGHHGNVNALACSPDGAHLFAGSGENVLFGEIKEWNVADGSLVRVLAGHKDAVYALAVSPDGNTLASGSYDQKIKLWDIATGREIKTLSGHNGCIFGLAFRPDGKILASASADHTVKLWDVAGGARRDTLSQPLKDVYALAFSPDGKRLFAGGVDNRIRVWQISESAGETTNPLLDSKFAHEGAILRLALSDDGKLLVSAADDRTVRIWNADDMTERVLLEKQPDWVSGLDFLLDGKEIAAGRLDGSLDFYDLTGRRVASVPAAQGAEKKKEEPAMPAKPQIARLEPRGMQRGTEIKVKISGTDLLGVTRVKFDNPKLTGTVSPDEKATATELWIKVKAAAELPRAGYDLWLAAANGESDKLKFYADDLPQAFEPAKSFEKVPSLSLPVSYWGTLNPMGDTDEAAFRASGGQTLVFDLATKSIGSKAEGELTLLDDAGNILASHGDLDNGDPLLSYTFAKTGRYRIRIAESTSAGSPDHYYRLSMGQLPEVVGVFPMSVQTNASARVQLIGFNLAGKDKIWITPTNTGEITVPLDPDKFRARRTFKVLVTDGPELVESEPNDTPAQATPIPVPCVVCGRISSAAGGQSDVDLYRFNAKASRPLIIETDAARRGSPIDTKIEVLDLKGRPVERAQMQAVRDSAINFRGITSDGQDIRVDNWQEMELNQYLYMQGEVCKLFRLPRGPDSGFLFYASGGKRRDYFDTSPADHPLDEPCYIVEPHPPKESLAPNGLPVFPVYYENDDDADRQLGSDSRLHFTAPADGAYLVRVSDIRGRGGDRFSYRLIVRPAMPDFTVALGDTSPTISPGSGRGFTVNAARIDGFDGDIKVAFGGAPAGFAISTPLVIQAGHSEARGTINCQTNAAEPAAEVMAKMKITALGRVDGTNRVKEVKPFEKIKIGEAPKLEVAVEASMPAATNLPPRSPGEPPLEITIAPGQIVPAWIAIRRHGFDDLATFDAENLPHGVMIDNIGLNGVLIPKGEDSRQIFLRALKWVPDTDRLFYIQAKEAGDPTSLPVLLHVRRNAALSADAQLR